MTLAKLYPVEGNHVVSSYRNVVVQLTRGEATLTLARTTHRALRECLEKYPQGTAFLNPVAASAPALSAPVRAAYMELIRDLGDGIKAAAIVPEETGFAASIVQAIVAGITLIIRPPFPVKLFSSVDQAAGWLVTLLERRGAALTTRVELVRIVEELRATAR